MITFVCGRAGYGKSDYILREIKKSCADGKETLLIVPEQEGLIWERKLTKTLVGSELLSIEVLSFTRLGNRVAREYGGFMHKCADKAQKRLLMWSALSSVRAELKFYSSSKTEKLVPSFLAVAKEFSTYRVSPSDLNEIINNFSDDSPSAENLKNKLSDLALVISAYEKLLFDNFDDADTLSEHTASLVAEKRFFSGMNVFIDGFYSLTPAQTDIAGCALRDADNVCMTFACPETSTEEKQFDHIRKYFNNMKHISDGYGGYNLVSLSENKRTKTSDLSVLERKLWNFTDTETHGLRGGINILCATDRYDEAAVAAEKIKALVRGGAKYHEIAVISSNAEALYGITDTVMRDAEIPFYTARRKTLASSAVATLLLSVLKVHAYGWRREDVISVLKTGLVPLKRETIDNFEKYSSVWHLRGKNAFCSSEPYFMDPAGIGQGEMSEERLQILEDANTVKDTVCAYISAFSEVFDKGEAKAVDVARALYKFLCDCNVAEILCNHAEALNLAGYTTEAAEELQMWDALCDVLDVLATTIPDAVGDAESYCRILYQITNAVDVGTIPTGIDEVTFGSADMLRVDNIKHTIILGATDEEFPRSVSDGGLLTENERIILEGEGLVMSETGKYATSKELFLAYNALCIASDSVTIIVPQKNDGKIHPSLCVRRIFDIFDGAKSAFLSNVENIKQRDDLTFGIWNKKDAISNARSTSDKEFKTAVLELFPDTVDEWDGDDDTCDKNIIQHIIGDTLYLSQSRIDTYSSCPFMYFAQNILGLEADYDSRTGANHTGTFIHAVLEDYMKQVGEYPSVPSDEESNAIADKIIDKHANLLWNKARTTRQEYLLSRMKKSLKVLIHNLNEEFAQSKFRVFACEQKVGFYGDDNIPAPKITLDEGIRVIMRGSIDRIDVYNDDGTTYFRVVDYKTGEKTFSLPSADKKSDIQLLLYLFAIWKSDKCNFRDKLLENNDNLIPAGAMYLSYDANKVSSDVFLEAGNGFERSVEKVTRSGIILDDSKIIKAMDKELSGKYSPIKLKPDGDIDTKKSSVASIDVLDGLSAQIENLVKETAKKIVSGDASATPAYSGGIIKCSYCNFANVCRKSRILRKDTRT